MMPGVLNNEVADADMTLDSITPSRQRYHLQVNDRRLASRT